MFKENYQVLLATIVPVDHQALCRYFKIKWKTKKTKDKNGTILSMLNVLAEESALHKLYTITQIVTIQLYSKFRFKSMHS